MRTGAMEMGTSLYSCRNTVKHDQQEGSEGKQIICFLQSSSLLSQDLLLLRSNWKPICQVARVI
jgi:hypothetical protein